MRSSCTRQSAFLVAARRRDHPGGDCLLGLLAFTAFVVDYGIMWVEPRPGADRGRCRRAWPARSRSRSKRRPISPARRRRRGPSRCERVLGQAPDVQSSDERRCHVSRRARRGARAARHLREGGRLPQSGARQPAADVLRQPGRRHQSGRARDGDRADRHRQPTDCLKPWAILDRWDEFDAPAANPITRVPIPTSTPTRPTTSTRRARASPPQENDLYVPPSATATGTGFRLPADEGRRFAVKVDDNTRRDFVRLVPRDPNSAARRPDWRQRLPRQHRELRRAAERLSRTPATVCPTNIRQRRCRRTGPTQGCYAAEPGNMVGPTGQGIDDAHRAGSVGARGAATAIVGSAFSPATTSPRVVPIGVIDIDHYPVSGPERRERRRRRW